MDPDKTIHLPPVEWCKLADESDDERLGAASRLMDLRAIAATRCARYFSARSLGKSHREAVKMANATVRKLAKSLGYAYPASHEIQF